MARFRNSTSLTQVFTFHGIDEEPRTLQPGAVIEADATQVKHLTWLVPVEG